MWLVLVLLLTARLITHARIELDFGVKLNIVITIQSGRNYDRNYRQIEDIKSIGTHSLSSREMRCFIFAWLAEYSASSRANRTFRFSTENSSFSTPPSSESCARCASGLNKTNCHLNLHTPG